MSGYTGRAPGVAHGRLVNICSVRSASLSRFILYGEVCARIFTISEREQQTVN